MPFDIIGYVLFAGLFLLNVGRYIFPVLQTVLHSRRLYGQWKVERRETLEHTTVLRVQYDEVSSLRQRCLEQKLEISSEDWLEPTFFDGKGKVKSFFGFLINPSVFERIRDHNNAYAAVLRLNARNFRTALGMAEDGYARTASPVTAETRLQQRFTAFASSARAKDLKPVLDTVRAHVSQLPPGELRWVLLYPNGYEQTFTLSPTPKQVQDAVQTYSMLFCTGEANVEDFATQADVVMFAHRYELVADAGH